nr:retrotransposon protein, putative, unclassified [Tanacetum cinerariifolium]
MADFAWIEAMQEELHHIQVFSNSSDGRENGISQWSTEGGGLQIHQSPRGIFINQAKYALEILYKHGMDKGQSIGTPMAMKPKLDADLSGNPVDQTDYHSKIGSLMYLTSSKPDIVHANRTAMSSAKAEYMALSASCAQVMWMRTQLQDYGFNYNKIPLYCDSQSAIAISCNTIQLSRTKHIHTRYHFIKEQVENGIIELYFVRTKYQLADMFTKALPEDRFKYLLRRIAGCLRVTNDTSSPLWLRIGCKMMSTLFSLGPVDVTPELKPTIAPSPYEPFSPGYEIRRRCCSLILIESDSTPHAHAQTTKTSANSDKQDLPSRYQVYQGRLLASFQDDARRVNGHIKCNLSGHVYQAKAQVILSPACERNQKYKYPPLHHGEWVMDAPIIPVFIEENLGDPIDIRVDIIHPESVAAVAFPAAAVVRTQAQHGEAIRGMHEQLLGVPIQEELTALRFRVD